MNSRRLIDLVLQADTTLLDHGRGRLCASRQIWIVDVRFVPKADIPAYADLVFTPSAVNACLCLTTNTTAICAASWCSEQHAGLIGVAG